MKEFVIRQKKMSLGDSFEIKDAAGKEVYKVKGNPLEFGSQSSFQTMDGTEIARLEQTNSTKLKPWKDFVWKKDGKEWAKAKQDDWGLLNKKSISIDIPGENDYKITGDRMSWHFQILKGDEMVGRIDKKMGWSDTYAVTVSEGAEEVDLLMCGILVDQVYHDNDDHQ